MKDKYQDELRRQQQGQQQLEKAMARQETQAQRDEELSVLEKWLNKQPV